MLKLSKIILTTGIFAICSCASIPKGIQAVKPFNVEKFMGTWYEIARFDLRFERNLNNVTATYTLNKNGSIKVENRGYNYVTNEWKQAIGKAKGTGEPNEARLKVSFFGPFYAGYNVIAIDNEYKYALIAGSSHKYLWILSRQTTIPDSIKETYINLARQSGFNTSALIWTAHNN